MKKTAVFLILLLPFFAMAQSVKESITPLSKGAKKGFLDELKVGNDGSVKLTYQMKGGGKDEILTEEYDLNADHKLVENKQVSTKKEMKGDVEKERMGAWVGACSSFDINSMRLRVSRDRLLMEWNYKKQRYERKKTLDSETIKLKNESGKNYKGIDAFYDEEDDKIVVFVYTETKDKETPRKYAIVKFGTAGDAEESPIDVTGSYSIVYTQSVNNGDEDYDDGFIAILAPNKGAVNKYLFLHYDLKGNMKSKVYFDSPASAMLVNAVVQRDKAFYLFGLSVKTKDGYDSEFDDYQPLPNPCYKEYANYAMVSYTKKADRDMDNLHFIKIQDGAMKFASTTPFKSIKEKMKIPKSQKGGSPYKGGKFVPNTVFVTPSEEYLMTGQLTGWGFVRGVSSTITTYGDIVCLHFDKEGQFKVQYAVDRLDDDKKSKVFFLDQSFYYSADGKTATWLIMEAKGLKGFSSFAAFYYNVPSFYPREYPRFAQINLETGDFVSDFTVIGEQKYFVNQKYRTKDGLLFIGKDEDEENIWIGELNLNK